jgi:hypothetical protein
VAGIGGEAGKQVEHCGHRHAVRPQRRDADRAVRHRPSHLEHHRPPIGEIGGPPAIIRPGVKMDDAGSRVTAACRLGGDRGRRDRQEWVLPPLPIAVERRRDDDWLAHDLSL